jgi:fermentation-respiration switch protein FrsA (DUF1100 family)
MLFLAGAKDELVPPSHMVKLHELCESRAEKTWITFSQGMHNDTCMQPGYFTAVREYLEKHVLKQEEEPKKTTVMDQSFIDGQPVNEKNDESYQLVSEVADEQGMTQSFQLEEVELEEED